MGPFSEELQYKRAEAIERLLKNNPQLDAITKSMWEQKLKGLCYAEDSYNARVRMIFSGVKRFTDEITSRRYGIN